MRWISRWCNGLRECLNDLASVIFPPVCAMCGGEVVLGGMSDAVTIWKGYGICAQCRSQLKWLSPPFCPRCAAPFASKAVSSHLCGECLGSPPWFHSAHAVFIYGEELFPLLHRMKYGPDAALAGLMGALMARFLKDKLKALKANIIVPIPLHVKRLRHRGFNQSAILAKELSKALGVPLDPWSLKRVKATASQIGLSRSQRVENLKGAFAISDPKRLMQKKVLLVDDVLTTGATANEASRTLLKAGANEIHIAVFARVA